jgi:integrase
MMLVEGLGWRVSAICALRACDIELKASPAAPHGRIHRRAETDKMGRDRWIPMSTTVRAAIDRVRSVNPAIGGWSEKDPRRSRRAISGWTRRRSSPSSANRPSFVK